jgi:hypothetical protein
MDKKRAGASQARDSSGASCEVDDKMSPCEGRAEYGGNTPKALANSAPLRQRGGEACLGNPRETWVWHAIRARNVNRTSCAGRNHRPSALPISTSANRKGTHYYAPNNTRSR